MRLKHILLYALAIACAVTSANGQTATKKTTPTTTAAKKTATAPVRKPATTTGALATDDDKAVYSIGLSIYNSLSQFNLSPSDLELVKRAMSDAAAGKPAVELQAWAPKIEPLMKARMVKISTAYLAKCAAEPGVTKTPSGLIYKDLKVGTGPSPAPEDKVKVNYSGTFPNGKVFDASKEPIEFGLNQVIRCWTEGVQKMKVGGKAHLVCPSDIAYGDQGRPGIPGGSTLVFDVELLGIAGK